MAREFEVALPHELNDEQRSDLAVAIGQALVARYGFALQASIHSPGSRDGLNHHVHLLATTRRLTSEGFAEKTRELDGGASGKIEIEWIRQAIAFTINEHLAAAGIDARVDHRRLEVQAEEALARGDWAEAMVLSRQPTKHVGKTATALARKGVMTERAAENARIVRDNEKAFEQLLAQAEREGRATLGSAGHSHDRAQRDRRHRVGSTKDLPSSVPGLEIHGLRGMRLSEALGWSAEEMEPRPMRSIGELAMEAARDLAEILSTRSDLVLVATQRLLRKWTAQTATFVDNADLRRGLDGLVERLGRLKLSVVKFAQRTSALWRAEKLFHLAEQAWEQFNGDHPRPDGEWAAQEWEKRRGRRLAVLENERPNWRQPGQRSPSSGGTTTRTRLRSARLKWNSGAKRCSQVQSLKSSMALLHLSTLLQPCPSLRRCQCQRRNQHAAGRGPDGYRKPRICGAFFLGP
nr:MobA/MobL family protein [Xanthomonas campestris pv. campestris]